MVNRVTVYLIVTFWLTFDGVFYGTTFSKITLQLTNGSVVLMVKYGGILLRPISKISVVESKCDIKLTNCGPLTSTWLALSPSSSKFDRSWLKFDVLISQSTMIPESWCFNLPISRGYVVWLWSNQWLKWPMQIFGFLDLADPKMSKTPKNLVFGR